jgi:hypothetical protein
MKRMQWEKPYIQQIIDSLSPHGRVLQVGFGDGYPSELLKEHPLLELVIIEKDPALFPLAQAFAQKHPTTHVIFKPWQQALEDLGSFDVIYFHDVLLKDISVMQQAQERGKHVLLQGKHALALAHDLFPDIHKNKYTLDDLETFFLTEGKKHPQELVRFLYELYENHQITHETYHDFSKKHGLSLYVAKMKQEPKPTDEGHLFLQQALAHHLKKGGRFSMFCLDPISKYEDPGFFDQIITNPDIDYHEKLIEVNVPKDCPYYQGSSALVITVHKV